jgi:hypothetical protein
VYRAQRGTYRAGESHAEFIASSMYFALLNT